MKAIEQGYTPAVLLNVMNETGKISRSHGIPESILRAQAATAELPIHLISSSWQEYEQHFTAGRNMNNILLLHYNNSEKLIQ